MAKSKALMSFPIKGFLLQEQERFLPNKLHVHGTCVSEYSHYKMIPFYKNDEIPTPNVCTISENATFKPRHV